MSKLVSSSTPTSSDLSRSNPGQNIERENMRNLVPKSPKIQQILNDYWTDTRNRRKAEPN